MVSEDVELVVSVNSFFSESPSGALAAAAALMRRPTHGTEAAWNKKLEDRRCGMVREDVKLVVKVKRFF